MSQGGDASVYGAVPISRDEFSVEDELLAWDAEGGGYGLRRGEIRWYTFRLPDKRPSVLMLTRSELIDRLNEIIVVPTTRTIRGLTTEVVLTADGGMPTVCALNFELTWHSRSGIDESARLCAVCRNRNGLKCGVRCLSRAASMSQKASSRERYVAIDMTGSSGAGGVRVYLG